MQVITHFFWVTENLPGKHEHEFGRGEVIAEWNQASDDSYEKDHAKSISDVERETIIATLKKVGGNRRRAAKILGIGERTLYRKISKYNLHSI